MRSVLRYGLILVLTYVVFVVVRFPADRAVAIMQQQGMSLQLAEVRGTVWQGQAGLAQVGRMQLENLQWDIQQTRLLTGKLALQLTFDYRGERFDLMAGIDLGGALFVRDDDLDIAQLDKLFMPVALGLQGTVALDLDDIQFNGRQLQALSGDIILQDIVIEPLNVELGDYKFSFESDDAGIKAIISDDEAALSVDGTVLIQPNGQYRMNVALQVSDPERKELRHALSLLGSPSPAGKITINRSGRLPF